MRTVEKSIRGHLSSQPNHLKKLVSAEFRDNDLAVIEELLPTELREALHREAN